MRHGNSIRIFDSSPLHDEYISHVFLFFSDGSQEISVLIYSEEIWLQPSNGKPEEKPK